MTFCHKFAAKIAFFFQTRKIFLHFVTDSRSIHPRENSKKVKKPQKVVRMMPAIAGSRKKQYLCSVKRIQYISPVEWMSGSLSGRQDLKYNGGRAYGESGLVPADDYKPRLIAKVAHVYTRNRFNYFQVRTRTSVNITAKQKMNLALMGGSGALFASLLSDKTAQIYTQCVAAVPNGETLRSFVVPIMRTALAAKSATISIASGVTIINPWVSSETPNVPVSQAIIAKFASELSTNN